MISVSRDQLEELLAQLDEATRDRWKELLERVDAELAEKGPMALREHLDAALGHLLAIGWALHRCYSTDESASIMGPLGDAATTVEELRASLDQIAKKPEWSH
jgi:hypothetical protein